MRCRRRATIAHAKLLTVDNLEEVAARCEGSIRGVNLPTAQRCIDMQTIAGEARAEVGDWVILEGEQFFAAMGIPGRL